MPASRTVQEVRDEFLAEFATLWADATPVAWPNVHFDPATEGGDQWIRANFQHGPAEIASLGGEGSRSFRRTGVFSVQVFTRVGNGSELSDALVQQVLDVVEGATLAGVRLQDTSPIEVGQDGEWWQVNVNSTFLYDIVR